MMFGHKILLLANKRRMIGEEVRQSGGCCGRSRHFDFAAVNQGSQVIFIRGRMEAVEMGQGSGHDRSRWRRRCHSGMTTMMMPIRLLMILMKRSRSARCSGCNHSRGRSYDRRCRWVIGRRGRLLVGRCCGYNRRWWIELGVLAFSVPPQVNFALKSSSAMIASKRFVAGVLPRVSDQVGRLTKGFAAYCALVRLFTCTQSNCLQLKICQAILFVCVFLRDILCK